MWPAEKATETSGGLACFRLVLLMFIRSSVATPRVLPVGTPLTALIGLQQMAEAGNVARQHRGGAIGNYGTLTITNSTFSGNSSSSSGFAGGILNGGLFQSTGT